MSASFFFTSALCALTMLGGAFAFLWTAQGWPPEMLWSEPASISAERPQVTIPMEGVVFEEMTAPDPAEIERDRRIHEMFSI
jgi:hypothetical protein